ncbi:MAG TPA: PilZ domain-containing protein [Gemmataceae bacterium]|nr:PilZ domain-containing protein [Gemmataceae bacterium]
MLVARPECSPCAAKANGREARKHTRVMCLDSNSVLRLAVRPEFRGRQAVMLDISPGGIGLVMAEPLQPGSTLVFELCGDDGMDSIGRLARVRHCRPHPVPAEAPWLPKAPVLSRLFRSLLRLEPPAPEGHAWFIGCEFDRALSEADMKHVLDRLQAAFA